MRLLRLVIDDFAQIDHLEIHFHECSPNVIVGPNEAGKSHIMQALYGMLFGLEQPQDLRPWSNPHGVPRGVLEFISDDGYHVCLDRDFATHRVTVVQDKQEPWSAIVGPHTQRAEAEEYYTRLERWLGFVDADIFTATTFVRQLDLAEANLQGLAPHLKGVMTGRRSTDYDRALAEIQAELDGLRMPSGTRNPRLLEQRKQELQEVEESYADARRQQDDIGRLQSRLQHVSDELSSIQRDREQRSARARDIEILLEREREIADLEAKYREAQVLLNRFVSAHQRIEQARLERHKYAIAENTDLVVLLDMEHRVREAEQHLAAMQKAVESRSPWTYWFPWIPVLLGVAAGVSIIFLLPHQLLALRGMLASKVTSPLAVAIAVVLLVFLLVAWRFGLWRDVPRESAEVREARSRLETVQAERSKLFSELGVDSVEETITLRRTFEGADRVLERAQAALDALGDEKEASSRWQEVHDQLLELQREVEDLLERDPDVRALGSPEKRAEYGRIVLGEIEALDERFTSLEAERDEIERELLLQEADERDVPVLLAQRRAMQSEVARIERRCNELTLAADMLQQSIQEFNDHILDPVMDRASALLSLVTAGRYSRVSLDHDTLAPHVDMPLRQGIEPSSLGRGVQDQLFFSLRVALAEALAGGRSLPLILDDPYVNLDAERLSHTVELLRTLSEHTQIILFTCHQQYALWFQPVAQLPADRDDHSAAQTA